MNAFILLQKITTGLVLFYFTAMASCASKQAEDKNVEVIYDSIKKEKIEIETRSSGSGGGITGSGPSMIKKRITKYNSTSTVIYTSYKEVSFQGCIGSTDVWEVSANIPDGNTKEMKKVGDNLYKITFTNKKGETDSTITLPYRDMSLLSWIDHRDD